MISPRIPQVGANPEYARILEIWQPMSGIFALLLQNAQKCTILNCLNLQYLGIFWADTNFECSGGCQMITLSRFYKWLGLPEFFNILKFLGQKEKIILQCVCALDDLHLISHEVHSLSLCPTTHTCKFCSAQKLGTFWGLLQFASFTYPTF